VTIRLYTNKRDAELAADLVARFTGEDVKLRRVQVTNEQAARGAGVVTCSDLSIGVHPPRQGETGWIVVWSGLKHGRGILFLTR